MSTSLSRRWWGSPEHPTRQQLDELDALLQRMLALPVNQADDDVTAEINGAPKNALALRQEPVSYHTIDDGDNGQTPAEDEEAAVEPKAPPRLDNAHVPPVDENQQDADNWVPLSSTWKPSPHTWKPPAHTWPQPRATPV